MVVLGSMDLEAIKNGKKKKCFEEEYEFEIFE